MDSMPAIFNLPQPGLLDRLRNFWLWATPKHPYFPNRYSPERMQFDLSGNLFAMNIPQPNVVHGNPREDKPSQLDIHDTRWYKEAERRFPIPHQEEEPLWFTLFTRSSWMVPYATAQEESGMMIYGAQVRWTKTLPKTMSCFQPAHFEQVVMRDVYFGFGPPKGNRAEKAPVNWQTFEHSPAIYCEAYPLDAQGQVSQGTGGTMNLYIPLAPQHYIRFITRIMKYESRELSLLNGKQIAHEMMNSYQLQLSPENQALADQIKAQYPHAKASSTRQPETWQYFKYDTVVSKILEAGTPPAPYQP